MDEYEAERLRQQDRAESFKRKLSDLLSEYDATITADDYWEGYAESGKDIQIHFEIGGSWGNELEYNESVSAKDLIKST